MDIEVERAQNDFVIFPWNDNFATGIAIIDEQHKVLVAILNKLANHFVHESSAPESLACVVQELADYADFHFKTEEEVWHKHFNGHPLLASHEQAHHDFFIKVSEIQHSRNNLEEFADELFGFLTRWLAFHILDNDKRMALATISMDCGADVDEALLSANQDMTGSLALLIRAVLDMYGELSASTIDLMKQKIARQRLEKELRDTAEQLVAEKLIASEERYHILINAMPDSIIVAHMASARIIDANIATEKLLGYSPQQLRSMQVFEIHPPETWAFHRENLAKLGAIEAPEESFETEVITSSGKLIDVEVSVHGPLLLQGQKCLVGVFRDITERKKHRSQLEYVAYFDELTGLPNRNGIKRHLDQLQAQSDKNVLIVHADMDDFSAINARYSSEFGDRLLKEFARQASANLSAGTLMARLGGDEFLLVIEHIESPGSIDTVITALLATLQQPVFVDGIDIHITVSAGVKFRASAELTSSEVILRQAAHALYMAKIAGKSRYHVLDQAQENEQRNKHLLLNEIEAALSKNEFELFYQPKVNMVTGAVSGVEALIRWRHPTKGLLTPGYFMPATEGHKVSLQIDNWVVRQATNQLLRWHDLLPDLRISVNLCAQSIQDPDFPSRILAMTTSGHTNVTRRLAIEVLEGSAMGDINTAISNLQACRDAGMIVAIDDFGTGYSSLSYLKKLPIDCLKIDQSFVRDMVNSKDDIALIQGFISISKAFDLNTVAEGVETIEQGKLLIAMGCSHGQGYAISRPLPVAELERWLTSWQTPDAWRQIQRARPESKQ